MTPVDDKTAHRFVLLVMGLLVLNAILAILVFTQVLTRQHGIIGISVVMVAMIGVLGWYVRRKRRAKRGGRM